ncbi:ESPR-type extended signal peptide-containing protein [uncultured Megasphaera sp.]|uniref:ESPR-type extended signal peptide-containing protein n=1 Tax=uncultured Megasphaera sp. TaxID=165188 RepID=UPI002868DD1E|nr:ESPR-type extended signal peptide-containing protein [uncultured Megasphaera sp.]
MNKIFKIIWSKARNCYVVVSELAKSHDDGHVRRSHSGCCRKAAVLAAFVLTTSLAGTSVWAQTVTTDTQATNKNNAAASQAVNIEKNTDATAQGSDAYVTYDSEGNLIAGKNNEVVKIQTDTKAGYTRMENQPENVVMGTRNGVGTFTHATDTVKPVTDNTSYSYEDIDTKWITTKVYNPATKQYEEKQIKVYSLVPGQYMDDAHNVRAKSPERAYYSSDADYNKAVEVYNNVATYIGTDSSSKSYYVSGATAVGIDNIAEGTNSTALGNKAKVLNAPSSYYVDGDGKLTSVEANARYWLDDQGNITTTRSGYYASDGTFVDRYLMVPRLTDSSNAVALGSDVLAAGRSAVAIGHDTHSKEYSVAIGEADNTDYSAVAIGYTNRAQYHSVAVGSKNAADGYYSLAQGDSNTLKGDYSSAVGYTNTVNGESSDRKASKSHAFGSENTIKGDYNLAAGDKNSIDKISGMAVGVGNQISMDHNQGNSNPINLDNQSGDYSIAVGLGNKSEKNALVIGKYSSALHDGSIAIGNSVNAESNNNNGATDSIAIGTGSKAMTMDSIAFGHGATIGNNNSQKFNGAIAIGKGADAENEQSLAIGYEAYTGNNKDVATNKDGSIIAIGTNAQAMAGYDIAIGAKASTASSKTSNSGGSAVAIGYNAVINDGAQRSVAMGANASVALNVQDAVALGSQSYVEQNQGANHQGGYDPSAKGIAHGDANSSTKDPVWNSTLGPISVGSASHWDNTTGTQTAQQTRQITNVAAGKEDTDAVNVAQLKAVQSQSASADRYVKSGSINTNNGTLSLKVENVTDPVEITGLTDYQLDTDTTKTKYDAGTHTLTLATKDTMNGGKAGASVTFTGIANTADVEAAKTEVAEGTNVSVGEKTATDGHTIYTVNAKDTTVSADDDNLVLTTTPNTETNVTNYGLKLANTVTIGSGDNTHPVTVDGTTGQVTGLQNTTLDVAGFATSHRAATEEQLKAVQDTITSKDTGGFGLKADDNNIVTQDLGKTITIKGGSNISTSVVTDEAGNKSLAVSLNKDVDLGDTGSLKAGDTTINSDGVNTNDVKIGDTGIELNENGLSLGKNGSEKQITNMASGINSKTNAYDIDTNGANIGDVKAISNAAAAAAKTEVIAGKNTHVTEVKPTAEDGHVTYKVEADSASVVSKNDNIVVTQNVTTGENGVTNTEYQLSLGDTINIGGQGKDSKDGVDGHIGVNGKDGVSGVGIDGKDGISIKGADGKDGVTIKGVVGKDGTEGHIGLTGAKGADGKNAAADIHVKNGQNGVDGTDGYGGKDGMDRVVYEDHNGTSHEVATMDDGMKYSGDSGNAAVKLNKNVQIYGGATEYADGNNIGVVASQYGDNAKLQVKLAKDLKGINSIEAKTITTGDTTMDNSGLTVKGDDNHSAITIQQGAVNMGGNKIEGVAPGKVSKDSTDAVNGSQLWQRDQAINGLSGSVNKLGNRINRVGAGAAALAALHPLDFDPDDKWDFAAGYGNYRGANAAAVGAYYRPNEDTMFSVGGSFGGGENMVNAGVSIKLGQGNHVSTSRVAMAKEMKAMRQHMAEQDALIAKLQSMHGMAVDPAKSTLFPDVAENHWAYQYVTTLAKKGILEGYPDGEFKGDRMMTRYEFAAIVYRIVESGVGSTDPELSKLVKEFSPELQYIRIDTIQKDHNGKPTIERVRVISDVK